MATYRPRMAAVLTVPVFGSSSQKDVQEKGTSTFNLPLNVIRAAWTRNDHNHADELELLVDWSTAGIDPRFLKNATVQFWMGNVGPGEDFAPNDSTNLRFVGICKRAQREAKSEGGLMVRLEFLDYTTLFLETKPFPTTGVPAYSDTLVEAWHKICDNTGAADSNNPSHIFSSVAALRERLVGFGNLDPSTIKLSVAAVPRLQKFDKVPIKPEADAWAAWEYVVGMCGLISWIDKDQCIVATTTELYGERSAPRMIWGQNVLSISESVNANFSNKGVCVSSFDTLTFKTIEAFYPKFFDSRIQKKNVVAVSKKSSPDEQQSDRYDYFEYPMVNSRDQLEVIAQRTYEERSRQEIEGTLRTCEMSVLDTSGVGADLLDLGPGDCISVEIDEKAKEILNWAAGASSRVDALMDIGYTRDVATALIRNMTAYSQLSSVMHVKRVHTTLEATDSGGMFEMDIGYHNRINIDGSSDQTNIT